MASSYYTNTLHVNFESILAMDDTGMVSMFQALMASVLEGFLGCPAVIYEAALVDFFENASVRYGVVISTVAGQLVEISEEWFVETFELPAVGLADLSEIPKDVIFDAKSIVSLSGEPVSTSGKKKEMKIQFRLLCDIMAKTISVKVGSSNAITVEKFLMLTAIVCGVRINWISVLFNIFKNMVTPGSKQAKGFVVKISLLLENVPNLELGESSEFPSSRILTEKAVHRYIVLNDKVGAEEVAAAPKVKKAPIKRAASKKRLAASAVGETVLKKKWTSKKKSGSSKENEEMVAVALEAVPIQMIAQIPTAPAADDEVEEQPADEVATATGEQEPAAKCVDEKMADTSADEEIVVENLTEPAVETTAEEIRTTSADDVDIIVEQVIAETAQMGPDEEVHEVGTSDVGDQLAGTTDDSVPCDTEDEEMETIVVGDQQLQTVDAADSRADAAADYCVEEPVEETETETGELSADEATSLEDIFLTIPVDFPIPSISVEVTKITLGKDIKIPGVDERTWYPAILPQIPVYDKGKEPLLEKDPVKGNTVKEQILLTLADIECLVKLREQVIDEVAKFFYSFSFKRLAQLQIDDSYFAKEELVLSWAEAESTGVALQRKLNFVPGEGSSATDLKIMDKLSDIHSFVLEELKEQEKAHGLTWKKTCCSKIFEGRPRDRGAVIARTNTNTPSKCWVRTMILVDGVWVVEPCSDHWVKIPRPIVNNEVPSLFSRLSTADITSFVASIASERTVLRSVQITLSSAVSQHIPSAAGTDFVAQRVPMVLDQRHFSSSSSDESMHFDYHDTAATAFYLPVTATPDVTEALAQLRASIEQIRERDDGAKLKDTLQLHLHGIEKRFTARFDDQDKVLGALRKDSHDQRSLLLLDIKSSQKQVSTQIATAALDTVDVTRVAKELDAKITYLDGQVAAIRSELFDFRAKVMEYYLNLSTQLGDLVDYIRGGDAKKGEGSSSHPQPPPDDQGRGSGNSGGDNVRTTDIVDRYSGPMSREGHSRGRSGGRRSSGNRGGSSKRKYPSNGGGSFRRSVEDWLG
ncbi:hypothetical protein F511_21902 [Dorcoceras hygrometricum]|uniref:Dystroglycan-like n=1 Tax=Dorcoceras hygrometricum TaxID=472368 RepID=A0A2Z7BDJ5_9LAMI|nr:hypothetical protein F511_21902 [Dorcoceras hygrometricum]